MLRAKMHMKMASKLPDHQRRCLVVILSKATALAMNMRRYPRCYIELVEILTARLRHTDVPLDPGSCRQRYMNKLITDT
jgi:hypothetical protein